VGRDFQEIQSLKKTLDSWAITSRIVGDLFEMTWFRFFAAFIGRDARSPGRTARHEFPVHSGELSTSRARTAAAPRVSTPSFSKISCTCFLTVHSLMPRMAAMRSEE